MPNQEKKKVREGYAVALPSKYNGRCSGEGADFITLNSTYGQQSKLAEDAKFPRFEIRLPVPKNDEEAQEMYNLSMRNIIEKGIVQIGYNIDVGVKKILFAGIDHPAQAEGVKPSAHLAGQRIADEWRYAPPERSSARTFKANEIEQTLLDMGLIDQNEIGKLDKVALMERIKSLKA